jgi:hypothetical protein
MYIHRSLYLNQGIPRSCKPLLAFNTRMYSLGDIWGNEDALKRIGDHDKVMKVHSQRTKLYRNAFRNLL